MVEVITGVAVFTILCLVTKALRLYGVVGLAILSMIFPAVTLVLALAGGTAYFIYRNITKGV